MVFYIFVPLLMSICLGGPQPPAQGGEKVIIAYELYSWQDGRANWIFALLPHTSRDKTVKEVFDPKFRIGGVEGVRKRLSKLPEKTTVFMVSRLPSGTKPKAKGSELLKLPPEDIIKLITDDAKKHNIMVEVPGAGSL